MKRGSISTKITAAKEKEQRKRKREEGERRRRKKKKAMVALLVFIKATLEIVCGQKLLLDGTGLFGGNLSKKPFRYSYDSFMHSLPTIILTENLMGLRLVP